MVTRIKSALMRIRTRERGIALLATMVAVALITLIVMDFTTTAALGYLSAANQANDIRAGYLSRSAVNVGLALLSLDSRMKAAATASGGLTGNSPSNTPGGTPPGGTPAGAAGGQSADTLLDVWAQRFPPAKVGGGTVNLSIVDEARKFNIHSTPLPHAQNPEMNGKPDPVAVGRLAALINILGLDPQIVPSIIDWEDQDSVDTPGGAEADYYLKLIPPYEPRNGPMPTIGDLRMVKGVDDAAFAKLRNYLTVAPEPKINLNTAPPELLAALDPRLAAAPRLILQLVEARTLRPFSNLTDFGNIKGIGEMFSGPTGLQTILTTTSQYFTITGVGNYAGARKVINSTFLRGSNGAPAQLISWQED